MADDKDTSLTGDAKLIDEAKKRFKVAADAEADFRKLQREDKAFAAGDQWPEGLKREREGEGRPCLTIDRLTPQIKQITNQQRQMRPQIAVHPVSGGDVETAEVFQGVCRAIELGTDADDAYDQAGNDQTIMGRGFVGIETDYLDDTSFDQEIKIVRKRRPETIYCDPAAEKRDYSDMMWAIEAYDLPMETYRARFGGSKVAKMGLDELRSEGDERPEWISEDTIRVVKYWHVETSTIKAPAAKGKQRDAEKRVVKCELLNALEVLERYDWPGKWIPLVPVIGEELVLDGKVDYRGMVRRAKDPQRMNNFWKTAATEMVALAKTAPWLVPEGAIEGYEKFWEDANRRNLPYLPYRLTSLAGTMAPPPQRNVAEPPIQALMAMTQASENDLRAATGFYDVESTSRREQSGKAILARQKQGEMGNSDFIDGLARAIRHVGRILIDLIPHIYDVPRVMRILGTDGNPQEVLIHAGNPEAAQQKLMEFQQQQQAEGQKIERAFDLSAGRYDVTVTAGPSFQSSRQEFIEQMGPIFQSRPELFQVLGDLFFENMDIPNAKAIAKRLKKLLPPQLQEQDGQPEMPPEAIAQMQQMAEQTQMLQQALQEAQQKLEAKQIEAESKERIASAELATKERIAQLQAEVAQMKAAIDAQMAQMKMDADLAKAAMAANRAEQSQRSDQAHQAGMAAQQAAAAATEPKGNK